MAQKKNFRGLTRRQEKFIENRMEGMSQGDAYVNAGYSANNSEKTRREAGCRIEALEAVQKRLAELQAIVDAGAIASLDQIAADLLKIASDESKPDSIRLKAYDQFAKLRGGYSNTYNINANVAGGVSIDDKRKMIEELLGE